MTLKSVLKNIIQHIKDNSHVKSSRMYGWCDMLLLLYFVIITFRYYYYYIIVLNSWHDPKYFRARKMGKFHFKIIKLK